MTHIEVLREWELEMRQRIENLAQQGLIALGNTYDRQAALTAAIAALDAVGKGTRVLVGSDNWIECSVPPDTNCEYIIIPADAVDAVGGG